MNVEDQNQAKCLWIMVGLSIPVLIAVCAAFAYTILVLLEPSGCRRSDRTAGIIGDPSLHSEDFS